MSAPTGLSWRSKLLGVFAMLLVSGVAVAIVQCVSIVIWPGEAAFTGPLFCASPYDEAIIVSDTESYAGESATNYTLMCVGARGQYRDAGFLGPWLVLWACHTALVFVVLSVAMAMARKRASARRAVELGSA